MWSSRVDVPSTFVVTIGEGFGAGGGVHDAPSGLRSTTKRVSAGFPAVHDRATAFFVAVVAVRAVGGFIAPAAACSADEREQAIRTNRTAGNQRFREVMAPR